MRYALLLVAGCGFKGASLGGTDVDAAPGTVDTKLVTADAPDDADVAMIDSPSTTTPDAAVDAMEMPPPMCPSGGTTIGNNVFYVSSDSHRWWEAETACEAMKLTTAGAKPVHLAVPSGVAELTACAALTGLNLWAWTGNFQSKSPPNHDKDQDWLSITGGVGMMNWRIGEPSDGGGTEDGTENFAQIYNDGTMNDTRGTDNIRYLCECDGKDVDMGNAAKEQDPPSS